MTSRNREKKRARAQARFDKRCQYEAQLSLFGWEAVMCGGMQGVRHIETRQVAWRDSEGRHYYDRTDKIYHWRDVAFSRLTNGFLWALIEWMNRKQKWQGGIEL